MTQRGFRDDISGLRGVAAFSVALFHFGVRPFGGGFAGVDIFFVISGLLMTQIIDRGIAAGNFSVIGFYAARTRRIVPALAVLCLVLVVLGAILLDPVTLGALGEDAFASLLFYSNILYATQSGYFAGASDANWLLHTWTLSVEWQFYLVYPIVLLLAARWRWLWAHRATAIGVTGVAAFAATMILSARSNSFEQYAFFLLPTRAWEMLAGGWLALGAPRIRSDAAARVLLVGGMAAILGTFLLLDATLPWPSPWMLLPVLGTLAVLAAERRGALWARVPGVQPLGAWSYSIYLWHWPIIAGMRYYGLTMGPIAIGVGLALTITAGFLSYELLETRLRRWLFGPTGGTNRRWALLGIAAAALLAVAGSASLSNGYERVRTARLDAAARARLADYRAAPGDWRGMAPCGGGKRFDTGRICTLGRGHPQRVAIVGDSHAEQMLPRLAMLAARNPIEITLIRLQGCPPLPHLRWTASGEQCPRFADRAFDAVERAHYPRVMVLAAWALYFGKPGGASPGSLCRMTWRGCRPLVIAADADAAVTDAFAAFAERLRRLRAGGADVTVVLPAPIPDGRTPGDYYRQVFFSRRPMVAPPIRRAVFLARTAHIRALLIAAAGQAGAHVLDPVTARCDAATCPVFENGAYIFKDSHHLRASVVTRPPFNYLDAALGVDN